MKDFPSIFLSGKEGKVFQIMLAIQNTFPPIPSITDCKKVQQVIYSTQPALSLLQHNNKKVS